MCLPCRQASNNITSYFLWVAFLLRDVCPSVLPSQPASSRPPSECRKPRQNGMGRTRANVFGISPGSILLLATAVRLLPAQQQPFPVDRSKCDSADDACTLGLTWMADTFPVRVTTYERPDGFDGYKGILNPDIGGIYRIPVGYEIDFTGGLKLPLEDYSTPITHTNDLGVTAYVSREVSIHVNDTDFEPANISVLPGAIVTWILDTFETVSVRSDDDGVSFNSGALNRIWSPKFVLNFSKEGTYSYRNAEQPSWKGGFRGHITVKNLNCTSYTSCTTCLAYDQCLWCSGNNTCMERDPSTNLPVDGNPVVAIPYDVTREYQSIRYYYAYNSREAVFQFDWYPWPPIRRNPRPVDNSEIPINYGAMFDPISSDQCVAYLRSRDGSQCEEYSARVVANQVPKKNRIHGVETAGRPVLDDWFMCYDHVSATWAKPEVEAPRPWAGWSQPTISTQASSSSSWHSICCDLCSSCYSRDLAACNITHCRLVDSTPEPMGIDPVQCLWNHSLQALLMAECTATRIGNECPAAIGRNASQCALTLSKAAGQGVVSNASTRVSQLSPIGSTLTAISDGRYRRLRDGNETEDVPDLLQTEYIPLGKSVRGHLLPDQPRMMLERPRPKGSPDSSRRQLQSFGEDEEVQTAWDLVPLKQKLLMPRVDAETDLWQAIELALEKIYGPRCNATHRCEPVQGACLNISGLPVIGYDQNGTCTCHHWYNGSTCANLRTDGDFCVGFKDVPDCQRIKQRLFYCGHSQERDALPSACVEQNLTVTQCGDAGHMAGRLNASGISNLVGRPDAGFAAVTCSKCLARADMRSETYAKLCDRAIVLAACQRHEDASSRRLCNLCGQETQGSVMPQRGIDRSCSLYRGTCIGSVEKRIRGIVPPNLDIVGQTMFGGLRYCKQATTFSSVQHYYTDADIMQVGQTCREGTTPVYEGWDWSKQYDHPATVRDRFGTACEDPGDEFTCPISRFCIDGDQCYTDTPDWMRVEEIIKHWGLGKIKHLADDPTCNKFGSGANTILLEDSISLDEEGNRIIIPCEFTRHDITLKPSDAGSKANWPFIEESYLAEYTQVTWSTEGAGVSPPPPPQFTFLG